MLVAIDRIHSYTVDVTFEQFRASPMRVEAVLYNFAVLGEAANHAGRHAAAAHPEIVWSDIRAMRNVVVHEYAGVRLETIWETVQRDLPRLREKLVSVLNSDPG
ncbi:MAG: DUF86 domain-containing protein [Planctomycetaceae bacterium]|nr:DUF86 domain-containing protein [Planctomycetaceae bacterium]